jgi:hypothetical protein
MIRQRSEGMSQKEKLEKKLLSDPRDFTFEEASRLLGFYGYTVNNKGRTSGSRVAFISKDYPAIILHKPHPRKELLPYQVDQLVEFLKKEGLLK